jgi:hypothetical protein
MYWVADFLSSFEPGVVLNLPPDDKNRSKSNGTTMPPEKRAKVTPMFALFVAILGSKHKYWICFTSLCIKNGLLFNNEYFAWSSLARVYAVDVLGYNLLSGPSELPPVSTIPKIIHQTYKTWDLIDDLGKGWEKSPEQWKALHPNWEYRFWDDAQLRHFIETEYPLYLHTFDSYHHQIQRVDFARYFILHKFGGVYSDLDIVPTKSLDDLLDTNYHQGFLWSTPNGGVTNALMAFTPGHKFLEQLHYQLTWSNFPLFPLQQQFHIIFSTGPVQVYFNYCCYYNNHLVPSIGLFNTHVFGKDGMCSVCASGETGCALDLAYFSHLDGSSWHDVVERAAPPTGQVAAPPKEQSRMFYFLSCYFVIFLVIFIALASTFRFIFSHCVDSQTGQRLESPMEFAKTTILPSVFMISMIFILDSLRF